MRASFEDLRSEALSLVAASEAHGLTVRLLGGVAVGLDSDAWQLAVRLGRESPSDIDIVVSASERDALRVKVLEPLGYREDVGLGVATQGQRLAFERDGGPAAVDVFVDRLVMCHQIDFRARLPRRESVLPASDLLLQKLQIVRLTQKDLIDSVVILRQSPFGAAVDELDAEYVVGLLADDWGFCHTVETNLAAIETELPHLELDDDERTEVAGRTIALRAAITDAPKTRRWRMRAKVGTKRRWYEEVDEMGAF